MTSAGAVSIQSARLSQAGIKRQILKEGSSVLVRVISDRGNGKYEGSVAGIRVQLTSNKALQPGQTFTASISIKNGSIVVTPKDIAAMSGSGLAGQIELQFNEVSQSQLFSLLEALGLPADYLSTSILQSFKQMGLKFDSSLANKIRSLALRFSGKEKSAAEILSLLAQKGLEADEEEIKALLYFLESENDSSSKNSENKEKLINRINSTEGSWYLLPFELVQLESYLSSSENLQVLGKGCIRLLFDSAKALKLLNLDCSYNNKKYLFSLSFEGRKIINTYLNVETEDKSLNPENEINRLKKLCMAANLNPGKISWVEKELIEGNASGLESFVSFGGRI